MKQLMKKFACSLIAVNLVTQAFMGVSASATKSFRDVGNHWAKAYIQLLTEREVINGYSDGTFAPDRTLSKAEAATLICTSAKITPSESSSTDLVDISGHWAEHYITALPHVVAHNNYFSPDSQITRGDFVQMIVGAMHLNLGDADNTILKQKFKDGAAVPQDISAYIALAAERKIISGYSDSTLRLNNTLTRAEACVMLKQAFFPDDALPQTNHNEWSYTLTGVWENVEYQSLQEYARLTLYPNGTAGLVERSCFYWGNFEAENDGSVSLYLKGSLWYSNMTIEWFEESADCCIRLSKGKNDRQMKFLQKYDSYGTHNIIGEITLSKMYDDTDYPNIDAQIREYKSK